MHGDTLSVMRRLAILALPVLALVLPATALALHDANTADGTLVVKNGSAPRGVPVVTLSIEGTAIGHISTGSPDQVDTVVVYDPNNTNVDVSGRLNPVSGLERGDVIDVQVSNAGSSLPFAQRITLVRNVRQ